MKKLQFEKTINELKPIYDSRQSFYKKAIVYTLKYNGSTTYILKSYDSVVSLITETADGVKFAYINNNISESLLYSNTTLRHIKEFLKQYYKNVDYTKADLKNYAITKFEYLHIYESNDGARVGTADGENLEIATCAETVNYWKKQGHNQKIQRPGNDTYILTTSKYGFVNYYYCKIEDLINE
jgi:hypothetical protein